MVYFLIPGAILFEFGPFVGNSTRVWPTDGPTDRPTDGRTDGRTDTPSYRDARTHLKRLLLPSVCSSVRPSDRPSVCSSYSLSLRLSLPQSITNVFKLWDFWAELWQKDIEDIFLGNWMENSRTGGLPESIFCAITFLLVSAFFDIRMFIWQTSIILK